LGVVLGCIADDFTGATDLAGLLARSGVQVSLRIGVPDKPDPDPAPFEVIALKCRTAPVAEAIAETRAALAWLKEAGAQHFFWKYCSTFDSTPKGNIGPVAEALMKDLDTNQTIYCPAFPENGRSIFMGHLFVGETPLHESPMKDHPLTPMLDSNLMRLLAPQVTGKVGLANRLTVAKGSTALNRRLLELAKDSVQHVVVDAVADEDLGVIAEACANMPLLTGGSAVAMPLPAIYQRKGILPAHTPKPTIPEFGAGSLVLSGSCSAMTQAQVAIFSNQAQSWKLDPLELAKNAKALEQAENWLRSQPLDAPKLIYATADPQSVRKAQDILGGERAGALVEEALAHLAKTALQIGIRRFVIAGGETSGAVTQALNVDRLSIGPEIAPGVPWTFAKSAGNDIALALKSGNFGDEDFFATALDMLK